MNKSKKARQTLDKRFDAIKPYEALARPPKGWLRAVRDALGMTTTQLARRMNISQPALYEYEKREVEGSITLNSLEKAAQAMGCRLIYAIVPEESLEALVQRQAERIAKAMFSKVEHSMGLEQQSLSQEESKRQFALFVEKILQEESSRIWNE